VFAIDDSAAKKRHAKRAKISATITLDQTPVFSGTLAARGRCRRNRYVEIRRASNDALVGGAHSDAGGYFSTAGNFSGLAYAHVNAGRRSRAKCRAANSSATPVGLADLKLTKAADGTAGGNPRYAITITNLGPDSAQDLVIKDTPRPVPPTGGFSLDVVNSSPDCRLAADVITCAQGSLGPGKSATQTIVLACGPGTVSLLNSASVSSSARDPSASNNTVSDVPSADCL
jgi:uncharacterized repeat protein (TIGR01451 family)